MNLLLNRVFILFKKKTKCTYICTCTCYYISKQMSYWTKRRKVCRNVDKHFAEIENAISDSEEELICSFDYKTSIPANFDY